MKTGRHSDLAHDLDVMKTAREVADATGLPIMMHWSDEPDLLAMLKKGDILTHPFNPPSPNSSNVFSLAAIAQADKVLLQISRSKTAESSRMANLPQPITRGKSPRKPRSRVVSGSDRDRHQQKNRRDSRQRVLVAMSEFLGTWECH